LHTLSAAVLNPFRRDWLPHAGNVSAPAAEETSKDAYVVKLLQAHAEVVSAFLANGMSEMMKNHPVPPR
jgi:hypothetical protein